MTMASSGERLREGGEVRDRRSGEREERR